MNLEAVFDRELSQRILNIIKMSCCGKCHLLAEGDIIMLYHWVRHMNDPMYSFVPKKYRK